MKYFKANVKSYLKSCYDNKCLREFFKDANRLSIEDISDLDSIIEKRTKNLLLNYIHDDENLIHDTDTGQ